MRGLSMMGGAEPWQVKRQGVIRARAWWSNLRPATHWRPPQLVVFRPAPHRVAHARRPFRRAGPRGPCSRSRDPEWPRLRSRRSKTGTQDWDWRS